MKELNTIAPTLTDVSTALTWLDDYVTTVQNNKGTHPALTQFESNFVLSIFHLCGDGKLPTEKQARVLIGIYFKYRFHVRIQSAKAAYASKKKEDVLP